MAEPPAMPSADAAPRTEKPARLRRALRELGPAGPLFVVAAVGPVFGVLALAATAGVWLPWFGQDAGSALTFWIGGALLAALCVVPTHATSLCAGYLFGGWLGAALAWLVVLLAAGVAFAVWQRLVGSRALRAIAGAEAALRVHAALLGRGPWRTAWLVALLRLSPVMPFAATNLLMAALGVRASAFLFGTVVGVTPRAVGAAVVGAELAELDWSAGLGAWSTWLAVAATVLAIALVGRLARAALRAEAGGDLGAAALATEDGRALPVRYPR
jgi:uncharacterized membrane protein YdjX (TVP38/TMEM64 family)